MEKSDSLRSNEEDILVAKFLQRERGRECDRDQEKMLKGRKEEEDG